MSKRGDGVRMKPMYRTAAEEALILAAIAWGHGYSDIPVAYARMRGRELKLSAAVRAVVRERGKKRRVKPDKPYVASMWPSPKFRGV